MLDQFIYEDHLGRRFVGLDNGVYMNQGQLRNYAWKYETVNSRISRFYHAVTNRKIPLVVFGASEEKALSARNRLFILAETDIEAKLPGKIYVGESYTNGFITSSNKSEYLTSKRLCKIDLTLTSDDPAWYHERTYSFIPGTGSANNFGVGADYPHDYKHDFALRMEGSYITCDTISSNAFRMMIFGPVTNPTISIGGHFYAIKGVVGDKETLLVDSLTKTIMLTTAAGNKINWFDKRVRESYIFEPIPPGKHAVGWPGTFGFNLTVVEKRSEPQWT